MLANATEWVVSYNPPAMSEKASFKILSFSISHVKKKQSLEFFLCSKIMMNLTQQQLPAWYLTQYTINTRVTGITFKQNK